MRRLAYESDIATAVLFFCREEARFITGQKLVVDGGLTC
jgi:NAD(P)-dependent dehydrogenase (short-subunit alcohol dehydrogenase family)